MWLRPQCSDCGTLVCAWRLREGRLPHRLLIAVDSLCAGTPTKVTGVVTLRGTYVSEPVVRLRSIRKWVESLMLAHQGGVALAPSVAIRVADRLKQSPLTQRERAGWRR